MGCLGKNMTILLSFITQPTKLCLILLVTSSFVHISHRWIIGTHVTDIVDDFTAGVFKTLQVTLGFSALHIVRYLLFQHFANVALFLVCRVPPNRLLLCCVLMLAVTIFVVVPGYSATGYFAWLYAGRVNININVFDFDYLERNRLLRPRPGWSGGDNPEIRIPRYTSWMKPAVFRQSPEQRHMAQMQARHTQMFKGIPRGNLFWRYPTEDILLPCELFVEMPRDTEYLFVHTWWMTNKGPVREDGERIRVTSHRGFLGWVPPENETQGTRWFFVKETMSIKRLLDSDFGHYVCRSVVTFLDLPLNETLYKELRKAPSTAVSEFRIRKPSLRQERVMVHPSDEVRIEILHRTLPDSHDDVLVEHRVNGIPEHELPESDKCSKEVDFLGFGRDRGNQVFRMSDPEGHRALIETHRICVEHYNYGLHTFYVRRQFYNPCTKQQDFVETEYFHSVLIVPVLSRQFSDTKNNAYFSFTHMADCWDETRAKDTEFCNSQLRRLKLTSRLHYMLDSWAMKVIYVLLHLHWLWWTYGIVKYVLKLTIPELFCNFVVTTASPLDIEKEPHMTQCSKRHHTYETLHETLHTEATDCNQVLKNRHKTCKTELVEGTLTSSDEPSSTAILCTAVHDLFLAYALDDSVVCERVKAVLASNDVSVYDSQRDVRPGQSALSAWDLAMEHSQALVVLVSRQYLAQPELMLQFQIIQNLLLEQRLTQDRLLLLLTGNCPLPLALGPLLVIDLDLRHWQRHLEWWALTLKGQFNHRSVLMQMGRDMHRDSRDLLELSRRDDDVQQLVPGLPSLVQQLEAVCGTLTLPLKKNGANVPFCDHLTWQAREPLAAHGLCTVCFEDVGIVEREHGINHLGNQTHRTNDGYGNPDVHDVFLTYCEESISDCEIARKLKMVLEGGGMTKQSVGEEEGPREGLNVYDAVQDLPPGHPEVHVVSAAADSTAYIVLLSPAYCHDPLARRLHFPQVLHAVFSDRVPLHHVLIVHTSGTFDLLGQDTERGDEGVCEDRVVLPEWFRAFTNIHWSPVTGLCEEDRLSVWIRNVMYARKHTRGY